MLIWISLGLIVGITGFLVDKDRSIENFVRNALLGLVGSLQGMFLSQILQTVPVVEESISPLLFGVFGGLLLLTFGKLTRKAF